LRDVPNGVNAKNTCIDNRNKSGVIGVYRHGQIGKWVAQITLNGKARYLGVFDRIEDAAKARKMAEEEFGYHRNHGRAPTQDKLGKD